MGYALSPSASEERQPFDICQTKVMPKDDTLSVITDVSARLQDFTKFKTHLVFLIHLYGKLYPNPQRMLSNSFGKLGVKKKNPGHQKGTEFS